MEFSPVQSAYVGIRAIFYHSTLFALTSMTSSFVFGLVLLNSLWSFPAKLPPIKPVNAPVKVVNRATNPYTVLTK